MVLTLTVRSTERIQFLNITKQIIHFALVAFLYIYYTSVEPAVAVGFMDKNINAKHLRIQLDTRYLIFS